MVADISIPVSKAVSGSTYGATNDTVTAAGFSGSALDQVAVEWSYVMGAVTYGGTILRSLVSGGSGSATFAKFRFQYWSGGQTLTVNPTYTSITLVGDGGREPFTKVVQSAVQHDYFLPGVSSNITTHEDIPLVHPSIIIDNTGQRTESYSDTTVPSKANYQSLVSAGALVCVEASTARRWKGEIFRAGHPLRGCGMRVPDKIKRFHPGDEDTPLHVDRINEIIAAINALLAMREESGARVHKSDGAIVIETE